MRIPPEFLNDPPMPENQASVPTQRRASLESPNTKPGFKVP